MNNTQLQTILAPIIGALAIWLASKFPLLDPTVWNTLITAIVGAGVAAFMGFITKNTALKNTVGNMSNTVVVTDKASADALPSNNSVVSNTDVKVVPKV